MKRIGELHVYKNWDRGRIKYFVHVKKGNRIVGKIIGVR